MSARDEERALLARFEGMAITADELCLRVMPYLAAYSPDAVKHVLDYVESTRVLGRLGAKPGPCSWCCSETEVCRTHPPRCVACGGRLRWYESVQTAYWRHVDLVAFYEGGAHPSVPVRGSRGDDSAVLAGECGHSVRVEGEPDVCAHCGGWLEDGVWVGDAGPIDPAAGYTCGGCGGWDNHWHGEGRASRRACRRCDCPDPRKCPRQGETPTSARCPDCSTPLGPPVGDGRRGCPNCGTYFSQEKHDGRAVQ